MKILFSKHQKSQERNPALLRRSSIAAPQEARSVPAGSIPEKGGVARRVAFLAFSIFFLATTAQCADNNFKFGQGSSNGDPLSTAGLLDYIVDHAVICGQDRYLTEVPNFTLDGNLGEYDSSHLFYTDPSGDNLEGPGTDLRNVYLGWSRLNGGSLVVFFQSDTTPSISHGFNMVGSQLYLNASFNTAPQVEATNFNRGNQTCRNRTDLIARSTSGYEIIIPLAQCLSLSNQGLVLGLVPTANGTIKVANFTNFNGFVDQVDLGNVRDCIYADFAL